MDVAEDRAVVEGRVARALEIARHRSGRTQEEMVRALSPYQSRPAKHQQRWHDWVSRPRSVSSVALVAAARMAKTTVDALLVEAGESPKPADTSALELAGRVSGLEDRLAEFMGVVIRLQQTVETQGALLDRVAEAMELNATPLDSDIGGRTAASRRTSE